MAYHIKKSTAKNTKKPWLIMDGNKIIGRSDQKAKALRSVGYREEAMIKKETGMMSGKKKVL